MQNCNWITWKIDKKMKFSLNNMENWQAIVENIQLPVRIMEIAPKAWNMPTQDVSKFTPVSYRTLALWGGCPALILLLQLITPSRASGTTDHVQSLDDLLCMFEHWGWVWVWIGVGCPCPAIRNNIVSLLFKCNVNVSDVDGEKIFTCRWYSF